MIKALRTMVSHVGLLSLGMVVLGAMPASAEDADLVKRGEYLTTVGDCVACHTAPGGEKFAGGLYMKTPVGSVATPNLTPDKETGIGNWSEDQFYSALHDGVDDHGAYLYPAFPFPWYTKVTKDDVHAIHAYLGSLKPVHAPRKPLQMGFPFNIRTALLTWRIAFFKEGAFVPDPKASDEINRGAYLVTGLGHCGECHNSQKLTGASVWSGTLEGGQIEGWYAPNITSDGRDGVGRWKKDDIVAYLKTGSRPDHTSVALGPMKETIMDSTSKMSDADLGAIAAYLKSVAAKPSYGKEASSAGMPTAPGNDQAYLTYCSSCHQRDGKGLPGAIPGLATNGSVTAKGPENVIRVVLGGLQAQDGLSPMPALGQSMSDQEVADAVNYVRSNWGNTAPADVGPGAVGALRKQALTTLAMNRPDACAPVKDANIQKAADTGDVKAKLETMDLADMLPTIDAILPIIKKGAPDAKPDEIVNDMTQVYCPIVMTKVPSERKSKVLGDFAVLVYGQTKNNGTSN